MKKFLSRRGVKEEIINFDPSNVTEQTFKSVSALVRSKHKSFDAKSISRASAAAVPLAAWVTANIGYISVLHKITPLKNELLEAERELDFSKNEIKEYEREIQSINQKVATLKDKFAGKIKETESIRSSIENEEGKYEGSSLLLRQLEGKFWSAM